jgi:PAB-dependent poly(A)-specific ribonuclease subunit 2
MLLAIDAEFVMFSPEEKVSQNGMESVTRAARLGLARISVLRGDPGPDSGDCAALG